QRQAKAILELRLQRLTSLEVDKVVDEYAQVIKQIEQLNSFSLLFGTRLADV
ncbi:MAG: hypothetical protein IH937_13245, partial [Acidobacteria bacterium]|nr:hypothetical protein [Acidobacteriota bacterium]